MTLVFMEREYASPDEPHLGIVHLVEVNSSFPSMLQMSRDLCQMVSFVRITSSGWCQLVVFANIFLTRLLLLHFHFFSYRKGTPFIPDISAVSTVACCNKVSNNRQGFLLCFTLSLQSLHSPLYLYLLLVLI